MVVGYCPPCLVNDIGIPALQVHLGEVLYLGIPFDVDADEFKKILAEKIEPQVHGVVTTSIGLIALTGANLGKYCEAMGLPLDDASIVLQLIEARSEQSINALGYSQIKLLNLAARIQTGRHIVIYDTCGSDPTWTNRIDLYVRSKISTCGGGAVKIVYPLVSGRHIDFQVPASSALVQTCTDERVRKSAAGKTINDLLNLV